MLKIVKTEHRASSSFENQIFGATSGSGMGMMSSRIQKPPVDFTSIQRKQDKPRTRNKKKEFKLPEMPSTNNSIKSSEKIEIAPLKLPGLSVSTQASTLNKQCKTPMKTHKNDKVYRKKDSLPITPIKTDTPLKKTTIDFKVLNLASLNNRFDSNISRQSSKISDKKITVHFA